MCEAVLLALGIKLPEPALRFIAGYAAPLPGFVSIETPTLIVGCGGGHDIFTCLPWYGWLTNSQRALCTLANYSFTDDLHLLPPAIPAPNNQTSQKSDATAIDRTSQKSELPEVLSAAANCSAPTTCVANQKPECRAAPAAACDRPKTGIDVAAAVVAAVTNNVGPLANIGGYGYGLKELREAVVRVEFNCARSNKQRDYFPELELSTALDGIPILAIRLFPNPILAEALLIVMGGLGIRQVILVDGGVDALLWRAERPYGSPFEDSQMMVAATDAAARLAIPCWVVGSALHIDEVNPTTFLKNWKSIAASKMTRTAQLRITDDAGFALYRRAVRHLPNPSIIQESIVAAVEGRRGRHLQERLFPQRIDDRNAIPDLHDESADLWWADARWWVAASPFYQELRRHSPNLTQESCFERTLATLSIQWNRATHSALEDAMPTI
jgi:hypothetical protein